MAKTINIDYTFGPELMTDLSKAVVEEMLKSPLLQSMFGIIETGVKNDKKIGFINTSLGKMLKAPMNCSASGSTFERSMETAEKTWSPKGVAFYNEECKTNLQASLGQYVMNAGINSYDLTNTQWYAFFLSYLPDNLAKDVFRYAWFGDTAAKNIAAGGAITAGVDATYYTQFDGIWKQLMAIIAAAPARKTALTGNPNGQATFALQDSVLTPANVTDSLWNVYEQADIRLRSASNKVYITTDLVYLRLVKDLQMNKGTDTLMMKLIEGINVPTFNGTPIISCPVWDEIIRSDFSNGTIYSNPHRILLTTNDNLALGFQSDGAFDEFNVFYDKKSRLNVIEGEDQMDAKVLRDWSIQLGI